MPEKIHARTRTHTGTLKYGTEREKGRRYIIISGIQASLSIHGVSGEGVLQGSKGGQGRWRKNERERHREDR